MLPLLLLGADHPDALTFKDASQHGSHLHVGWVEGPGILGENLTLLADADAERDMPGGQAGAAGGQARDVYSTARSTQAGSSAGCTIVRLACS